jgi:hypothetical protein
MSTMFVAVPERRSRRSLAAAITALALLGALIIPAIAEGSGSPTVTVSFVDLPTDAAAGDEIDITVEITGSVDVSVLTGTGPLKATLSVNGSSPLEETPTIVTTSGGERVRATFAGVILAGGQNTLSAAAVYNEEELATTSATVTTWDVVEDCTAESCPPASLTSDFGIGGVPFTVSLQLDGGVEGRQFLSFLDGVDPYTLGLDPETGRNGCSSVDTRRRLPETVLFETVLFDDSIEGATATITLIVPRTNVPGLNSPSDFDICYVSDKSFTAKAGARDLTLIEAPELADTPPFTHGPGLLPTCGAVDNAAPCIVGRNAAGGGTFPAVEIVLRVPAGDPMFR